MDTHMEVINYNSLKHVLHNITDFIWLKSVLAYILISLHWLFDKDFEFVWTIILLIAIDTGTGVWVASRAGTISSRGFRQSFSKLFVYMLMLSTGALVDKTLPVAVCLELMVIFLSATEGISILENCGKLGFPVPQKIIKKLEAFRE